MKQRILVSLGLLAAALPAWSGTNVGVSVSVNQPGVYGRIDIGHVPVPPVVVYEQPVVIAPAPTHVVQQPIYLHVPPGHSKNWRKHCRKYGACGQPVYFVQDRWYQTEYVPAVRHRHRDHDGDRHRGGRGGDGGGRDGGRGGDGGRDHRHDRDHDRGHGKGHRD